MNTKTKLSDHSTLEDMTLIKTFQAGNESVFDQLVKRYEDKIFNLCYRFFKDYDEANDLSQDIFIKAYGSLLKFRFESSFSTWLFRIGVNTCKNRLKSLDYKFKKRIKRLDNPGRTTGNGPSFDIADESNSPIMRLEKKERSTILLKAIDSLPETKRTLILLRDMEGMSYNEIVEITGFKLGTVKSNISRARSELVERLRGAL